MCLRKSAAAAMAAAIDGGLKMRINRDYEQEINIRDMFFDLAYRWRSILAAALIGAVALGVFQYTYLAVIHGQGKITKEERQFQIDLQNYQDSMRNAQSSIRDYTKLISEQNEYLAESIYMSLDTQKEWFSSKTYYIRMDPSALEALPANSMEDPADYAAAVYVSNRILTEGAPAVADYMKFLSAGGSVPPLEALRLVGVDMEKPQTVRDALRVFADAVTRLEGLLA